MLILTAGNITVKGTAMATEQTSAEEDHKMAENNISTSSIEL